MAVIESGTQILSADDRKFEDVPCPEWGGDVRIVSMSGTERDAFEASMMRGKGKDTEVNLENLRAKLVAHTAVNSGFTRLFSDAQIVELGCKNANPLDRCFTAAQRLSGITKEDVETMVGNSEAAQSGDSTSASPSPSDAPSVSSSPESAPES